MGMLNILENLITTCDYINPLIEEVTLHKRTTFLINVADAPCVAKAERQRIKTYTEQVIGNEFVFQVSNKQADRTAEILSKHNVEFWQW